MSRNVGQNKNWDSAVYSTLFNMPLYLLYPQKYSRQNLQSLLLPSWESHKFMHIKIIHKSNTALYLINKYTMNISGEAEI